MARTIADLRALFEVMQGPDDGDTSAAPVPIRWPQREEFKNLRIGYFEDDGRTPVTPETRVAIHTAAKALEKAGFRIARQGKHIVMTDGTRIITIPRHNPVNAFTMGGIVRDAGLSAEQFRELL